ncbi:MAG: hypothetical protein CMG74_08110, partial [Candidatus Marinimicrobia bacterium]|nr:hypothetical protein [Candidatus Neomarinimicrobiota bacterium]
SGNDDKIAWYEHVQEIPYTYVPDDNFEQALIDLGYDDVLDDYVATHNIRSVTSLDVSSKSINDLTGIEDFTALTNLQCDDNSLTGLDVSSNTALTVLSCGTNQLTSLELTSNTALTSLMCPDNQIALLDVRSLTAITDLRCYNNQMVHLNMKNGVTDALTYFDATDNSFGCIEVKAEDVDYATANWTSGNGNIDDGVEFNVVCAAEGYTYVPDDNFEQALISLGYDDALNDFILTENISDINSLDLNDWQHDASDIIDITGIQDFTGLTWLDLGENQITGEIPSGIGNLTNLTLLRLRGNQLNGEIPSEIGNLTSLETLELNGNQLTGEIPSELGNLTNLTTLNLYGNQLTGSIEYICNLTSLTYITIADNDFTGGFNSIGNLINLTYFQGWGNSFGEAIPPGIGNLINVTEFTCTQCELTGELPSEFGSMINLSVLDFRDNELSGEIPASIGNLTNLSGLSLSENQLSGGIPPEIGNLTSLESLDLMGNQLTGEIPSEIYNLENLRRLTLRNNELTGEISQEISNLTNLTLLQLNNNHLTGEIPESICNLDLDWSLSQWHGQSTIFNNTLCIAPFPDCVAEFVGDQNCSKTYIPDNNFEQALIELGYDDVLDDSVRTYQISFVTSLNVNNKEITDLIGISGFTSLTDLDCGGTGATANQLTTLDLSNNTALTTLFCHGNQLTSLDVSYNTALTELRCNNNQLTSLDVSYNTALVKLECQENQLTSLDASNNTLLMDIGADGNELSSINVTNNSQLTHLRLFNNNLTGIDISNNSLLEVVNLGGNTSISTLNVSHCQNLTFLNLDGAGISDLVLGNNQNLEILDVRGGNLANLDVSNHAGLRELYCHFNPLTELDLSNNTSLVNLDAGHTDIVTFNLSSNSALERVVVGNNDDLTELNFKNGITTQLTYGSFQNTPQLSCIETLNPSWFDTNSDANTGNILVDENMEFNVICNSAERTHWYVDTTGSDQTGSGTISSPLSSIQTAINAATDGDTISVAAGTYVENINFRGRNIKLVGQDMETTIIDGNQNGRVVTIDNQENSELLLKNFTIQNGYATGEFPDYRGGGIYCGNSTSPVLESLKIINNLSEREAGGIKLSDTNAKIKNVIIKDNYAGSEGGGIGGGGSGSPVLENVLIVGNNASNGGGIYLEGSMSPVIINSTITSNVSRTSNGGGIACNRTAHPMLFNSILWYNSPTEIYLGAFVADSDYSSITIDFSNISGGLDSVTIVQGTTLNWGNDNINLSPAFVDTGSGDYHLSDLSAAISAGTDTITISGVLYSSPTTDLDGMSRPNPVGTAPDMGAFESDKGVDPDYAGPVWHVDGPAGLTYGNGGPGAPFITIQEGINASSNGDTVSVRNGTYMENINFNGKNIALIGEDRETTIIDGNNIGRAVFIDGGSSLSNFTVQNGTGSSWDTRGSGIYANGNVILNNLIVKNNTNIEGEGAGIFLDMVSNQIATLKNSLISGNTGDGIVCSSGSPLIDNVTIINNSLAGIYLRPNASGSHPTLINSIIYGNSDNNQIHMSSGGNAHLSAIDISYCLVEGGQSSISQVLNDTINWGSGNLSVDPMFVDTANSNYHLQASSMLINAGHPDSTDSDGSRADIGAYPFDTDNSSGIWHVSTSGSDKYGTGLQQNPFRTIQAGINLADNGDKVSVASGTYQENLIIRGRNIRLVGENKDQTIIDAGGTGSGILVTDIIQHNYNSGELDTVQINNFTIKNGTGMQDLTNSNGSGDEYGGGIYVFKGNGSFKDIIFENNTANNGGGIAAQDASIEIDRCIFRSNDCRSWGTVFWGRGVGVKMYNTLIHDNIYSGSNNEIGSTINLSGGMYKFVNLTVANNSGYPIHGIDQDQTIVLVNSILTWRQGQGRRPSFNPSNESYYYLYNNIIRSGIKTGGIFNDSSSVISFGNYYFEPFFVDTANWDYRLSDNSNAISSGRNTLSITGPIGSHGMDYWFQIDELGSLDIDGNARLQPSGSIVDIGAFENSGGVYSYTSDKYLVSASSPFGNGSFGTPYATIEQALHKVYEYGGDTILVMDGTYLESIEFDRYWGWGENFVLISENGPSTTIIQGHPEIGRCIKIGDNSVATEINGFTLRGGTGSQGSGILMNGPITLKNLLVYGNSADQRGGGIVSHGASLMENVDVFDNTVSGTTVDNYGGGIVIETLGDASPPILRNVNIYNNSSWNGAGIYFQNSGAILENVKIYNNTADNQGGGVFQSTGSNLGINADKVTYDNVIITSNNADSGTELFLNYGTKSIFTNSIIYKDTLSDQDNRLIKTTPGSDMTFLQSVVWSKSENIIKLDGGGGSGTSPVFSASYSNFSNGRNGISSTIDFNSFATWGPGMIDVDPMFINVADINYQLSGDSRLIDAGHPDSTDVDGTIADIGAYYYDQTGQPARVRGLITTPTDSRIFIKWDASKEADLAGYNVYRSLNGNEDFYSASPYTTVTDTNYVEVAPGENVTYFYRVSALDNGGDEGLLAFKEHGRIGMKSTSFSMVNGFGNVSIDNVREDSYTLEGFFKFTSGHNGSAFGFPTEMLLKSSSSGDNVQLQLYDLNQATGQIFVIDTSWHHIAFSLTDDNHTIIWIDGYAAMESDRLIGDIGGFELRSIEGTMVIDEIKFSDTIKYSEGFIPINNAGFDENTTLGYWKMDEGSLDDQIPALYDRSGNGHHIYLSGLWNGQDLGLENSTFLDNAPQRTDIENAIVINEIMPNPSGSDGGKEWFELHNQWFTPVHLKGWTILGDGVNESHVLASDLEIVKGGYGLLGQTSDSISNGGYVPGYIYGTTVSLSNFGEKLTILNGSGLAVDSVDFDNSFPFSSGVSMELIRPDYDNNDISKWIAAGLPYGGSGNLGTPGYRNAAYSGTIVLEASSVDYGYVTQGMESQREFKIYNHGVAVLSLESISLVSEFFSLSLDHTLILPGDSIDVTVTFAPQAVQVYIDTITILSDDPYNPVKNVIITGSAINEFADIVVTGNGNDSLYNYEFPFTRLGESRTLLLKVINIGAPDLEMEEIILEGDPEFSSSVEAAILEFMDTLSMEVTYAPSVIGSSTATLTFGSNDPDESNYVLELFGQAADNIILFVPSEYPTISAALDSAYQLDTIEIAPGAYSTTVNLGTKNMVFRGGGSADETIIQGNGTGPVLTINGGQDNNTLIKNMTIIGGGGTQGGGILVDGSSNPVFNNIIISANVVSGNGAGMAILSGSADMSHMTISGNTAGGTGGALYAGMGSTVILDQSILWSNGTVEIGSFGNVTSSYSIISGGADGTGNINDDPMFVNGPALNFNLQWHSPAIDGGDPSSDMDPDGTVGDIGALYYDQSLQPPDPVTGLEYTILPGQTHLSWNENSEPDLVSYIIYRGITLDTLDSIALVLAPASSFTDSTMDPGIIHYYQAGAVDTADQVSDLVDMITVSFPILDLSDTVVSLGDIRTSDSVSVPLTLANNGSDTLFVDSIYVLDSGSGFSIALSQSRTSSSLGARLHASLVPTSGNRPRSSISTANYSNSNDENDDENNTGSKSNTFMSTTQIIAPDHSDSFLSLSRESMTMRLEVEVLPGESIGLDISFSREDTATVNTNLKITSNDLLGNNDITVLLTARSVSPVLSISSTEIFFGNSLTDSTISVAVSNIGTDTLHISGLNIPVTEFSYYLSDSTLDPGTDAILSVTFSSSQTGYWTGDLILESDSYQSSSSPVSISALKIPVQSHDYEGVLLGQSMDHVFSYDNLGNTHLSISSVTTTTSDYSVDLSDITIDSGSSANLTVTFSPSIRDSINGSILFTTPAFEEDLTVGSMLGQGWVLPDANFAATSISVVTSRGNNADFDIELTNSGDYPLNYTTTVEADYAGWIWMNTADSGQVSGTSATDINVQVVNTANLDPGTYSGIISFNTNTGSDPETLVSNSHIVSVFLNLLGDNSELTDTTVTIAAGNTPPIVFTDESGTPIGLTLDFANSTGGTVTVQSVTTQPPVDADTPVNDPDGLITDPVYPERYYELDTDIEGSFVTDIGLDYRTLAGINNPGSLRLAKRPSNAGLSEPWVVISLAETEIDTTNKEVIAKNQTSFSQWAMMSNALDNSFTDTKGPSWSSMSISPEQPGAFVDALVSVILTDDTGIDVATLYYKQGGSGNFNSVEMTGVSDTYTGTIPGSAVTQNGLIYFISSQDILGFPTITDTVGVSVNFASGSLTTGSASNSAYPGGLPKEAWRLISSPAELSQKGLTQVLDELGVQDNTLWRVFRYDGNSTTYKDNPVDLNSGESYWIYQTIQDNLTLSAPAGATGNMSGTELTLETGWNFIGSPYPFSISLVLDQVQFYGPLSYGISGESWSSVVTNLNPWNGYVIYNRTTSSQTITLDPVSDAESSSVSRVMQKEEGWLMSIRASAGEYDDIYNIFGAVTGAENGQDWRDNPEITAPGSSVSISFILPNGIESHPVTSDIRSLDHALKVWDGRIRNNTAEYVTVEWSLAQKTPEDYEVKIIDLNTKTVLNMLENNKILLGIVDKRYDRRFNIVSGDPAKVSYKVTEILASIPDNLTLDGNYPNPFNPVTSIRFGLPDPRRVSISIVNILGQEVKVLIDDWRDIGHHEVRWDGTDSRGSFVASGVYFAVLRDAKQVRVTKMMLLK